MFDIVTKTSSAGGRARRRLGSTSTYPYYAFRHITKSSSAAGRTRCCVLLLLLMTLLYVETHNIDKCLSCQANF